MANEENKCIICKRVINENNSPSSSSRIGLNKICDECLDRLNEQSPDDED